MSFNMARKIVIIEPVNLIRETLKMVVHQESDAVLQGTLTNINALFPLLDMREVNVIFCEVFDENMSLIDGISSLRKIKANHPNVDLIIHTEIEEPALLIQTHADAIYSKRNSMETTRCNLRKILKEELAVSALFHEERKNTYNYSYLSIHEWEILKLFCKAYSIKDIAILKKSSYKGISRIKRNIMRSLKISNNTQFKKTIINLNKTMGQ